MLEILALVLAAGRYAAAQDMTAVVTSGSTSSNSGLLAYTTITTACLPPVDPNNEPIFSIQTNTVVESCTYVVNADNTAQVISTIGSTQTASPAGTTSGEVPLTTVVGTNSESMSGPPITTSTTLSTDSSASTSPSNMAATPTTDMPTSATSGAAETPTDGAAGRIAMSGEVLGAIGLLAVLLGL